MLQYQVILLCYLFSLLQNAAICFKHINTVQSQLALSYIYRLGENLCSFIKDSCINSPRHSMKFALFEVSDKVL
jgi:hypothetical protein